MSKLWGGFGGLILGKKIPIFFNFLPAVSIAGYGFVVNGDTESIVKYLGLMKVAIAFVKYIPQVYQNYKRRSTEGWSLENVLLDFIGGSLIITQIIIDWVDKGNSRDFRVGLNIAKFLLGILSVIFDLVFLVQHFCLYNPKNRAYELRDGDGEDSIDADNECNF